MSGRVVHCKREPYDVYIGRPSKYGNPFVLKSEADRTDAMMDKFEAYARKQIADGRWTLDELRSLHGKTLGCWCAPRRCHGDVLLKLIAEAVEAKS